MRAAVAFNYFNSPAGVLFCSFVIDVGFLFVVIIYENRIPIFDYVAREIVALKEICELYCRPSVFTITTSSIAMNRLPIQIRLSNWRPSIFSLT